jgi:hypothetical protein
MDMADRCLKGATQSSRTRLRVSEKQEDPDKFAEEGRYRVFAQASMADSPQSMVQTPVLSSLPSNI